MPRPKPRSVEERIQDLTQHGILNVECGKKGEILKVKHVTFGWISVGAWNNLRLFKAATPILTNFFNEFVKGGYQLKAWMWNTPINVDVLASGVTVPFGVIILASALVLYAYDAYNFQQAQSNYQSEVNEYPVLLANYNAALASWQNNVQAANSQFQTETAILAEAGYSLANPPPKTSPDYIVYQECLKLLQILQQLETNPPNGPPPVPTVPSLVNVQLQMIFDLACLVLPFGELYILYRVFGAIFADLIKWILGQFKNGTAAGVGDWITNFTGGIVEYVATGGTDIIVYVWNLITNPF